MFAFAVHSTSFSLVLFQFQVACVENSEAEFYCDLMNCVSPLYSICAGLGVEYQVASQAPPSPLHTPQRGTVDAEMKDPSIKNTELKGSLFKALSRSEYSHACFTYCLGFLPWTNVYRPGPVTFIFPNPLLTFSCVVANAGSSVGPQNKTGPPARFHRRLMQFSVLSAHGI